MAARRVKKASRGHKPGKKAAKHAKARLARVPKKKAKPGFRQKKAVAKLRMALAPKSPIAKAPTRFALRSAHMRTISESLMKNLLVEIAGEKSLQVAGELSQPMTDEALAEAAKIKISEVRAVMNKLHSARLASYARTRNEDGWYTYTWSLALDQARKILEERGLVGKGQKAGAADLGDHYACPNCFAQTGKKFCFDKAAEAEFKCPDCSEMLRYVEKKG